LPDGARQNKSATLTDLLRENCVQEELKWLQDHDREQPNVKEHRRAQNDKALALGSAPKVEPKSGDGEA